MKRLSIIVSISILTAMVCAFYITKKNQPYFLLITGKFDINATSQLFFNIGKSYSEKNSVKIKLQKNEQRKNLILPLPVKKIYGLRFDPLDTDGFIEIEKISIIGQKNDDPQDEILHEFDLKKLIAVQQVDMAINETGKLITTTQHGYTDPIIELPLNKPLDHWRISDFLNMKWFKKSIFLALLITPITVALSLSGTRGNEINGKIVFKVKKQLHTLEVGETFRAKPENCYQDTSEENIRSVIEEIKNGTHWKQAVKEKYKEANPWLYEIVCSPQRTKFIDEYIKPKNFQILDIGAGWGQFTIPLAKQNQICSLEPTPERLDFIKAASKQEGVDQNISYIGADYFDVKFENKFDLILSIGVLEWVGAFKTDKPPEEVQKEYLSKIKTELKEYGRLVIGIENRLGLKYLLGANDDHTGLPNISCLTSNLAKVKFKQQVDCELKCFTYSFSEYKKLLLKAGFKNIKFHVASPDYKLPTKIFPVKGEASNFNEFLLNNNWINEHDGSNGKTLLNQDQLQSVYFSIAEMNIAHYFAPSFFIEAT
jgi:2-polyprenyl-3-methyl-5-hydroxy-6-metoxy-1,4-benzoquinol methylase